MKKKKDKKKEREKRRAITSDKGVHPAGHVPEIFAIFSLGVSLKAF